jgi:ACS family glucarate transporter-like MFS transporter
MPHPRRWLLLAFLAAGMFFCYVHRVALPVAAPFLMRELQLDPAVMGVVLSAFFWTYSLAQVPAGIVVDRFGLGRSYAWGFGLWTLAAALTGFATSAPLLIAVRMLMGVGQGVAFPASTRGTANFFPAAERGGVTGLYLAGNRIGQAAITALGPLFIAAYGWQPFFLTTGVAGLLWLVPWLLTIRHWNQPATTTTAPPSFKQWIALLGDRRIAGIFLGFFAYDYAWFLIMNWMPGYLMLERKFSPREMSLSTSAPYLAVSLVVIGAGMLGDWLVRRGANEITARKSLITAGLIIGCAIVPAALVESNLLSAILLGLAICGLTISAPNAWALTQAVCPPNLVASASGIQNLGGNLGGVLAPALTGYIVKATGSFTPAFLFAGALLLAGIAAYWILIPRTNEPAA